MAIEAQIEQLAERARRAFAERLCALRDDVAAKNSDLHRISQSLVDDRIVGTQRLSTTGLSNVLNGSMVGAPDWDVVRTIVLACQRYARDHHVPLLQARVDLDMWKADRAKLVSRLEDLKDLAAATGGATAAVPRASTLAAAPSVFRGREKDLDRLRRVLTPSGQGRTQVPAAAVVVGMGGVGKTALALTAAHRAVEEGWFTDIPSVNLRGYDPVSVTAQQALGALLRALGTAPDDIPPGQGDREALYRSVLATFARDGRRVLVFVDNASHVDQIQPLLPGPGPHRLLATSRHTQTALASHGAHLIDLGVLKSDSEEESDPEATDDPAVGLVHDVLTRVDPTDTRVTEEREAAGRLVELCGRLPLALHLASSLLILDRCSLTALSDRLAGARSRLDHLDDSERALRATFALSYDRLPSDIARLFRLLALNPGSDFGLRAAVALADRHEHEIRVGLRELVRGHLLDGADERWSMHDLVRDYAAHHTGSRANSATSASKRESGAASVSPEDQAALGRVLEYYAATALAAANHAFALVGQAAPDGFAGSEEALTWLRDEHGNLLAVPELALSQGRLNLVTAHAAALHRYLERGRHFDELLAVAMTALDAAFRIGSPPAEAAALNNVGLALQRVRRFKASCIVLVTAADMRFNLGDQHGEASAVDNLGSALQQLGRLDEAITAHTRARDLHRAVDDDHGLATALHNLGNALYRNDQFGEAINSFSEAAKIFNRLGDTHHQAASLHNLGDALGREGHFDKALIAFASASDLFRRLNDDHGIATVQASRGEHLMEEGNYEEAVKTCTAAVEIFRRLKDDHSEAKGLTNLAYSLALMGRFKEAIPIQAESVAVFRRLEDHSSEGMARRRLGDTLFSVGRPGEAAVEWVGAANAFRAWGDAVQEATAMGLAAGLYMRIGDRDAALRAWLGTADAFERAGAPNDACLAREFADAVKSEGLDSDSLARLRRLLE